MSHAEEKDAAMPPVLRSTRNRTGVLELNRPRALNSLSPEMVRIIAQALEDWRHDPGIDQVLIFSGHPKAYCAGGDVRWAREQRLNGNDAAVDAFFDAEYDMNAALAEYPLPVIAVIDGIAMGGGLGISLHGSHRIVTANAWASMPEANIGYFTDVGVAFAATAAMGPELAKFWALTGYRMHAADLLYTGVATGFVDDAADYIDQVVAHGVDQVPTQLKLDDAPLAQLASDIHAAFSQPTWPEIVAAASPRLRELLDELTAQACPTSLVASLQLFDAEADCATVREALALEKRLARYIGAREDFSEGVRAVLVDKSNDARFDPEDVAGVDVDSIAGALQG